MSPETIALTLFEVVIFSKVISQLASEVSIIPEWDTFYTKNSNNFKIVKVTAAFCYLMDITYYLE